MSICHRLLAALAFAIATLTSPDARAAEPATSPSATASRLDDIIARGVLRVGSTGDYRPFSYRVGTGGFIGLDIALAADLAQPGWGETEEAV